jgi:hypothetical protein
MVRTPDENNKLGTGMYSIHLLSIPILDSHTFLHFDLFVNPLAVVLS